MADKPETAPDGQGQAERTQTPSGFVIFREAEGTTVWESRIATEGPHARIETEGRVLREEAGAKPNLLVSIRQAKIIIDGLGRFIKAAEGDELTEPAPEPDIYKSKYLGKPCWVSKAPKCPEHGTRLDLEWYKDDRVMWWCKTCTKEAKAGGR